MEQKLVDANILKCHLCNNYPRDAVELSCCSGLCCWECLMKKPFDHCSLCGSSSCDIESSRPSKIIQKLIDSMSYTCDICKEVFGSKELLLSHMRSSENYEDNKAERPNILLCPLALRPCKFHKHGCNEMLGHFQMEAHLRDDLHIHLNMLAKSFDSISESRNENSAIQSAEAKCHQNMPRHSCFCRGLNRLLPQPGSESIENVNENYNNNCSSRSCCKLALLVPLMIVLYLLKFSLCKLILIFIIFFAFFKFWSNLRRKCENNTQQNPNKNKNNRKNRNNNKSN